MAYLANRSVTLRNDAIVASTLVGSTITTNSITSKSLGFSTLNGSTITLNTATTGMLGFSTLVGSTITTNYTTTESLSVTSTMISIGPSTQSTMVGASQGSYAAASWQLTKSGLTNTRKVATSSTGQYQIVVSEATNGLWLSSDSGVTWSALGASQGLPVLEGSAYWSAGSISASGKDVMLAVYGGSLWFSSDYSRTFSTTALPTPDIWLPFNGSSVDLMGLSTVTATGSPSYVAFGQPGFTERAVSLVNTAGGTASQYVRGTAGSLDNLTVSLWMNMASFSTTTNVQFISIHNVISLYLNTTGQLNFFIPSGGGTGTAICGVSSILAINTWYYISATFQTNGLCSFYINNTLIGSITNVGGYGTFSKSGYYGIGTFSSGEPAIQAFNGHIADFRLYNSAIPYVPVPHLAPAYWLPMEGSVADKGSYSTVNVATPFVYLPFEGSVADSQGHSTVTATGAVSYVPTGAKGVSGTQAIQLANTAGGTATQYVRGTWSGADNFTVSFWFNPQSFSNSTNMQLFCAYNDSISVYINTSNQLSVYMPSGGGTNGVAFGTTFSLTMNTWYLVTFVFQVNGLCTLYVNGTLIQSVANTSGYGSYAPSVFSLGTFTSGTTQAFNGYIDDFKLWNTAFVQTPSPVPEPTIYLPLEGSVADQQGLSTVTATGSPAYTTSVRAGALGTQAINLANTAGQAATKYIEGTWSGSATGFTVSFWFYPTVTAAFQVMFNAYSGATALVYTNGVIDMYGASQVISSLSSLSINTWHFITAIYIPNGTCSLYINNSLNGTSVNSGGFGTSTRFVLGADNNQAFAFNGYIDDFKLYNYAVSTSAPAIYLPFEGSVADAQGGSAVTGTGITSADYVTSVPLGSTGIRSLNLANTAGGTASKYINLPYALGSSVTVSGWFNLQSTSVNQQSIVIFSSDTTFAMGLYVTNSNLFMIIRISVSDYIGVTNIPVSTNVWYYFTMIYQSSGTCSLYLNNTLVGSFSGQSLYVTPNRIFIGCGQILASQAFNGYIKDFRLWNVAMPYTPVAIVQPTGTMKYVPGVVGQTALWLENTAGGTPSNYIISSVSPGNNLTISAWINAQTLSSGYSSIISLGDTTYVSVAVYTLNQTLRFICNNALLGEVIIGSTTILLNVWYHIFFNVSVGGLCYAYLNGQLLSSATVPNLAATITRFSFATNSSGIVSAFNGYIDDFRIYNAAIPYSSLFPANYTHLTMSGNAAYRMAALQTGSQSGRLLLSSDSGSTWTVQNTAATPGAWSSLSSSYSGQYLTAQSQPVVQPNQSNLASATWSQQGVTYIVSASSSPGNPAYFSFNSRFDNGYGWNSAGNYNSSGVYNNTYSTTVQGGIGIVYGEWLQLQVSIPLILQSYTFATSWTFQLPKTYYIVGSNDGSTWFPIQYVSMITNPFSSATFTKMGSIIQANYTGTQMITGDTTGSGNTTSYPTSTQAYIYFRILCMSTWSGNIYSVVDIAEWYPNFLGGSITPNQSGLTSSSWSQSGVSWTASASSVLAGTLQPYGAFNNRFAFVSGDAYSWASSQFTYNVSNGAYLGAVSTTIQGGIGSVLGEWLQLQTSIPMILQAYTYACGGYPNLPNNYYIVGSNDGSTWYPLQRVVMTTNPLTANFTVCSTNIIMNYTGAQTIQGGTRGEGTTTAYAPYVTQAWQYFRIVAVSIYGVISGATQAEWGEFLPVFTAGQNSSTNYGLTWTPTLQTGDAFNVTKNLTVTSAGTGFATLPAFRPVSTGVTFSCWFTLQSAPGQWSRLFDMGPEQNNSIYVNFNTTGTLSFGRIVSGVYTSFTSTTTVSVGTIYHVVWTVDGSGNNRIYFNGAQDASTDSGAFNVINYTNFYIGKSLNSNDPYPNMTVRDFRMFNRALNAAEVNALYLNTNYGQPAVGPLTLSDSGQYALAAFDRTAEVDSGYLSGVQNSRWSNPLLSGIDAPIVDTAVSQSGKEMVLVTSSRLNNLYYSTDYGSTFTSLNIGSTALPSGAMPLARVPLDGSAVDVQAALSPATGAGTVTYSTSIVKVGTASALFSNTAGSGTPSVYLNYTLPPSLQQPPLLTQTGWVYLTALPASNTATPFAFNNGGSNNGSCCYVFPSGAIGLTVTSTGNPAGNGVTSSASAISINTWYHIAIVFNGSTALLYLNGTQLLSVSYTGSLCMANNASQVMTNMMIGVMTINYSSFAGYVDDVRLYNTALSAADVLALSNNAPALANDQSWPMVSCSISNDGSYLTATNSAGTVYRLNSNSSGYSVAVGSEAGAVNQAANSIAIGNKAGQINQSANSIVLNATGSALNTGTSGFYVAPVAASAGLPMEVLGYGADSQIVRTGVTILPGAIVGIGTSSPEARFELAGDSTSKILAQLNEIKFRGDGYSHFSIFGARAGRNYFSIANTSANGAIGTPGTDVLVISGANVGIGTTAPFSNLSLVEGASIYVGNSTASAFRFHHNSANHSYLDYGTGSLYIRSSTGIATEVDRLTITSTGNVGIGITTPNAKFEINGGANAGHIRITDGAHDGSGSTFLYPVASYYARQDGVRRTTDPLAAINGASASIVFTDRPGTATYAEFTRNSDILFYTANNLNDAGTILGIYPKERMRISANGNVGIGSASPGHALDVVGNIRASGHWYWAPLKNWYCTATGVNQDFTFDLINQGTYSGGTWGVWSDKNSRGILTVTGDTERVGILTATPGYTLHVIGDIYASGNITGLSDRRFKTNVEPLVGALDGVTALNGYTYFRPDHRPDERQMGLIAQEVETVFPEAVTYDKENDRYGVNYNAMIAPLVTAMKEMRAEYQVLVDSLRQEIRDLKQQLSVSI